MTPAQRRVLREMASSPGFPGYCQLQYDTGLPTWKSVDWVIGALVRRGYVSTDGPDPEVTEAGRAAIKAMTRPDAVRAP